MTDHKRIPFPKEAGTLEQQVQAWRKARSGPEPMPEALWNEAVHLARQFGVCLIARAVGIDYSGLRKKVRKAMEMPATLEQPAFIELPLSPAVPTATSEDQGGPWCGGGGSVIEISRQDGFKMRVHLEAGYWLCRKRLSRGRFNWWPPKADPASVGLLAHELQVLICGGDPQGAKVPPAWRPVGHPAGHVADTKYLN